LQKVIQIKPRSRGLRTLRSSLAAGSGSFPHEGVNTMTSTLLQAVSASPLAQDLSPEQAAVLAGVMREERHAAGAVLAREGTSDSRLYVVIAGTLGVIKAHGTPDQQLLLTMNPGDLVHELGFMDGAERYASLVARSEAQVLVLERAALESLIDSQPRVVYGVLRAIVRTVHRVQKGMAVQASELTNYIVKQHGRY
jgi:CRP/FNR family transcriptional regulator, cyclic AMP receptor protein